MFVASVAGANGGTFSCAIARAVVVVPHHRRTPRAAPIVQQSLQPTHPLLSRMQFVRE
jgi:hypothetical protein